MLLLLDLPSLESRRKLAKLIIMYKLINSNLHIPSNSLIPNHRDSRDGYQGRSRWSSQSGHGRTGFGRFQTIYRSRSSYKLYCNLRFKPISSLPQILFHALVR